MRTGTVQEHKRKGEKHSKVACGQDIPKYDRDHGLADARGRLLSLQESFSHSSRNSRIGTG